MEFETLETERLILRKLPPEKYKYIFSNYDEADIRNILALDTDAEYEYEKGKFEKGYESYNRSFINFHLIEKKSNTNMGACGFHNWCIDHSRAEVGYHINKDEYKRNGFMSEALAAVIKYGFDIMKLHRMEAMVGRQNEASQRLLTKNNFIQEGILREHYYVNEQHQDSVVFSLLKKEYEAKS